MIVSDGASPEMHAQHATVLEVLESLGATEAPRIDVLNKCDPLHGEAGRAARRAADIRADGRRRARAACAHRGRAQ